MGELAATIMDVADTRAYECTFPDDLRITAAGSSLAELMGLPAVDNNLLPINYGIVVKGGSALEPAPR